MNFTNHDQVYLFIYFFFLRNTNLARDIFLWPLNPPRRRQIIGHRISRLVTYSSIESRYFHDKLRIDEIPLKEIQCTMDAHQRVIFQRLVLNYAQHESDIFGHRSGIPLTDGKLRLIRDSISILPVFFFFHVIAL